MVILCAIVLATLAQSGCRINNMSAARRVAQVANLTSKSPVQVRRQNRRNRRSLLSPQWAVAAPQPTERTQLLLRRYNLADTYKKDPYQVIKWLKTYVKTQPQMEEVHALAELAKLHADLKLQSDDTQMATELYATAVFYAYQFLFDSQLKIQRNAYDPQFRSICDTYNTALEEMLRIICARDQLLPNATHLVGEGDLAFEFSVEVQGRWANQEFENFELVNDFQTVGLDNQYHTYGLGVPLIAVRKQQPPTTPAEQFYPPSLTFPMTAFLEVDDALNGARRAKLKLYDPLERTTVEVAGRTVPLESDITTPLAYYLNDPLLNTNLIATAGLLSPNFAEEIFGLYMLEPYDPNKIPVVMVHGLWSTPMTWMHMFNDLRASREIRQNYQFWFYSYPTGQPFWLSAQEMRDDLALARRQLDPFGNASALDKTILVGHSMGGLLSRMQTIESEDTFWKVVSDQKFEEVKGDPETVSKLRSTFYFHPNPSIRRVITIGTPHAGSTYANSATRWLGQKFITLPDVVMNERERLLKDNPDVFARSKMLNIKTSLDSLAAGSPFFDAIAAAEAGKDVQYHNIVGLAPQTFLNKISFSGQGDGVVGIESAKAIKAVSEIEVPAEHVKIHQHPQSVLEVRRILIEHLVDLGRTKPRRLPVLPVQFQTESLTDPNIRTAGELESVSENFEESFQR